jgi:hypothetical protein
MCECLEKMVSLGVLTQNMLDPNQYFIYPTEMKGGRHVVKKSPMLINYCPVCGKKIEHNIGKMIDDAIGYCNKSIDEMKTQRDV